MSADAPPPFDPVTRLDEAPVHSPESPAPWASTYQVLTPQMRDAGGKLGLVRNVLRPGSVGCPFHWHCQEDEVFFVLSGKGLLRYGETVREISAGDCIACPAGTKVAHQIGNHSLDEDLVYLAMGPYEKHEVCGYPDNGKVLVRDLGIVGRLAPKDYMDGEPITPEIFRLFEAQRTEASGGE